MLKNIAQQFLRFRFEFLVLTALIPIFFLNYPNTIDWGDDFAGYLLQALSHQNRTANASIENYLYNNGYFIYAPDRYPPLYPFVLHIFGEITTQEILSYIQLNSLLLILWAFTVFHFLKKENKTTAFLATILFAYFPFLIELKGEILSDILFSFLIMLSILFHLNNKEQNAILFFISGIVACSAFLTKSLGIFLPISFLIISIINSYKLKNILFYFSGYAICIIIGLLLFEWREFQNLIFFSKIAEQISTADVIKNNLNIYSELINFYPANFSSQYLFLIKWIYAILLTMGLIGLITSIKKIREPKNIYFGILFLLIIIFPNSRQGLRYLLPLFPFFMLFILEGFRIAFLNNPTIKASFKIVIPMLLFGILYLPQIKASAGRKIDKAQFLDYNHKTKPLFIFLKKTVKSDETICFKKARAIVLYTNKKCFANNIEYKLHETELEMKKFNPTYFVTGNLDVLYNPALEHYIKANQSKLDIVFSNENYNVFKWKNQ